MRHRKLYARAICGAIAASIPAAFALASPGCTNEAGDCRNTLSCPRPAYCAEAGDARLDGCYFDPEEDDGGDDAQGD